MKDRSKFQSDDDYILYLTYKMHQLVLKKVELTRAFEQKGIERSRLLGEAGYFFEKSAEQKLNEVNKKYPQYRTAFFSVVQHQNIPFNEETGELHAHAPNLEPKYNKKLAELLKIMGGKKSKKRKHKKSKKRKHKKSKKKRRKTRRHKKTKF